MVTRDELVRMLVELTAIEQQLASRIEAWRTLIDADGTPVKRIYRESMDPHRKPFTKEKHT